MPHPRQIRSRLHWDTDEVILAFESPPREGEEPKPKCWAWKMW
jgi:hypothetical protein